MTLKDEGAHETSIVVPMNVMKLLYLNFCNGEAAGT